MIISTAVLVPEHFYPTIKCCGEGGGGGGGEVGLTALLKRGELGARSPGSKPPG